MAKNRVRSFIRRARIVDDHLLCGLLRCAGSSGFLVDHKGARPVLFAGVGLLALSALTYAVSSSYVGLVIGAVLMGCGNGVFHPVDYTLMNHKISPKRLPYAYSFHGVTGYLGWPLPQSLW